MPWHLVSARGPVIILFYRMGFGGQFRSTEYLFLRIWRFFAFVFWFGFGGRRLCEPGRPGCNRARAESVPANPTTENRKTLKSNAGRCFESTPHSPQPQHKRPSFRRVPCKRPYCRRVPFKRPYFYSFVNIVYMCFVFFVSLRFYCVFSAAPSCKDLLHQWVGRRHSGECRFCFCDPSPMAIKIDFSGEYLCFFNFDFGKPGPQEAPIAIGGRR